jgi:hypothetical protein
MAISVLVWAMMGIAFWHLAVLVPDRFWGAIVGAFLAAVARALLSGLLLPEPGVPGGGSSLRRVRLSASYQLTYQPHRRA